MVIKIFCRITSFILPALLIYSCLKDDSLKLAYQGFRPQDLNDTWLISSPASENMDSTFLHMAFRLVYNEQRFWMARSLLVLRNGKLVAEAYPHDLNDRKQIQNIQSCTKSFTSILTGIALKQGLLDSLNQPFSEIYPEHFKHHTDKKDITLRQALTMRTGIDFNDGENTLELYQTTGSSVEYILNLPKNYPAGVVFNYNDGVPHLVSAAIQKRYGKPLANFANEYLFKPLQITEWIWESTNDGVTLGAVSLFLKPRDVAKFGQLLLNYGNWNGQQVVDTTWITECTAPLVTSDSYGAAYGYYFWVYPAYPGYAAIGHGGQRIFVVPIKNLVIIYTAWPYTSGEFFDEFKELADLIIESCR